MDKRTVGIIATVAAAIFCGCPGIFLGIFGVWAATGTMPYTTTLNEATSTGTTPASVGFGMLCVALILIAIPVVVGFLMLRNKPAAPVNNEPVPPAS